MGALFSKIDSFIESFMGPIFEKLTEIFMNFFSQGGNGAYVVLLLMGIFIGILLIIGLFRLMRKFKLFLILLILTVGISAVWFIFVGI